MNDATRAYINKAADTVRSAFDIAIPINSIDSLVQKLGGRIVEQPGFDQLYDGTIRKVGENSFEIAIFPYQENEMRNFTIAHELGHLFLHMGYLISKETWNQQSNMCAQRQRLLQKYLGLPILLISIGFPHSGQKRFAQD